MIIINLLFIIFIFMYYSVLWYKENPVIADYTAKYFLKLIEIFEWLSLMTQNLKDDFYSLEKQVQQDFLLHPDISSLLQETVFNKHELSEKKFIMELQEFCNGDKSKLTMYLGKKIPGTNIRLTLVDNNPNNNIIAHPWHNNDGGSIMWWWDRDEQEWLEIFWKAFKVLKMVNNDFFHELNWIIKKIVPMKTSIWVHNSCSYKECIGTLYLWYTIDSLEPEINILEALIHESSHNKLNLIMQYQALHLNNEDLKYYSPYRPDARHIHWVYLWVHAIIPTIHVMLEAIEKWYIQDPDLKEKTILYHIKNKLWCRVLKKYAIFTEKGKSIFEEMEEVVTLCDAKIKNNKDLQSIDFLRIQRIAKEHFLDVRQNYPHVQY